MEPLPDHLAHGLSAFRHGARNALQRFSMQIEIAGAREERRQNKTLDVPQNPVEFPVLRS